ncbi:MarR family winged helix-turn-helix transcriptional regulator [Streptomyces sp. NPDC057239]|uniref:MarR family winged helix-turn-helix transcriptional regulator n=1 Tax=Streptomyces sp. NPDC057239 TaxID=3346061 RepID=UPI003642AF4D
MQAKPRQPATPEQALWAMDQLVATHLVGQHEIAQQVGLNVTDLTCFAFVIEAGEDLLTAGELADRVHVTTGAMTGILNRLERAGYITRRPDPADRRRVRVEALSDALARTREIYDPYYARINELFADYTPEEIAVLHDWFRRANTVAADYLEEHCRTD